MKPAQTESKSAGEIVLKPRKAAPFFGRHPWVLDTAIAQVKRQPADGAVVDLLTEDGKWIARGIYNSRSRIRVRLYTWDPQEAVDEAFFRRKLSAAFALRKTLGYDNPRGACRLLFSESDGLSGLVIDRFADYLVVQPTSLAMGLRMPMLLPMLQELTGLSNILLRVDGAMARKEGSELVDTMLSGELPSGLLEIEEHGLRMKVELSTGQKTGFYLDQRENRQAAARLMAGRRVLDVCCYSGGFTLAAAKLGQAEHVTGLDTSEKAVELARENATLNGITNVDFITGDCFDVLQQQVAEGKKYGAVILDPPKFTASRAGVEGALRAYHRLNRLAVELLEPNGILVTCSCSGGVTREDFFEMLFGVALKTKRDIQVLEFRGPSPDHPVSLTCPESEYLKCFVCNVR